MSKIIPKEQLTAYQRWEMAALNEPPPAPVPAEPIVAAEGASPPVAEDLDLSHLPTAQQIELLQQAAHAEGLEAGHAEGYQAGLLLGRQEGAQDAQRLNELLLDLEESLEQFDDVVSRHVVTLAYAVAEQMVRGVVQFRAEPLLAVLREAIAELPLAKPSPRMMLHPDDAAVVRRMLASELEADRWQIIEDSSMSCGSAKLYTAHSEIDLTLETRLQRLRMALTLDESLLRELSGTPPGNRTAAGESS